jgi:hypothetical protein
MAAFTSADVSLTTTAVKIADAAEFNRTAVLTSSNGSTKVGYASGSLSSQFVARQNQSFVLPAGYELWAASTGASTLAVLITAK